MSVRMQAPQFQDVVIPTKRSEFATAILENLPG
jgi:hypothetical protein